MSAPELESVSEEHVFLEEIKRLRKDLNDCDAQFSDIREREREREDLERKDGVKRAPIVSGEELRQKSHDTRSALTAAESHLNSLRKRERGTYGVRPLDFPEEPGPDEKLTAERVEKFIAAAFSVPTEIVEDAWMRRCAEILRDHVEE